MKEKRSLIPTGLTHFLSFSAIVTTRNGTEGSNFISEATDMTTRIEMFGGFSNIKHATSTTGNTLDEMGGGARESVLDVVREP